MCHRIVAAGKLALVCHEYLKKGRQVFVEGRLRYGEWDTIPTAANNIAPKSLLLACNSWVRHRRKHRKAPNRIHPRGHPTVTSHLDYANNGRALERTVS